MIIVSLLVGVAASMYILDSSTRSLNEFSSWMEKVTKRIEEKTKVMEAETKEICELLKHSSEMRPTTKSDKILGGFIIGVSVLIILTPFVALAVWGFRS